MTSTLDRNKKRKGAYQKTAPPETIAKSAALEYYLSCPVCSQILRDPICLECNHSFCTNCLKKAWNQDEKRTCPVCQTPGPEEMPQVNVALTGLADLYAGRLKDKSKDELCDVHIIKAGWFCETENRLICEGCESVKSHAGHKLKTFKDLVAGTRQHIFEELTEMRHQQQECKDAEETYKQMARYSTSQVAVAQQKIRAEFQELYRFLKQEEATRLAAVQDEADRKKVAMEREVKRVQGQIQALSHVIGKVELEMEKDDVNFFKDIDKTKARVENTLPDHQVASGTLDVAKHLGNLRFQIWRKMTEIIKYYPVILDPNTADGWLYVSEDMTSMRQMQSKSDVPDNPERFTKYIYALGAEGFTSGRHCWQVEVGDRGRWSLGVAKESIERKDETYMEPRFGFWTIWMNEFNCTVGGIPIALEKRPEIVRIQLDYGKGELSFYNASDMSLIYMYQTAFTDKLYPFFSTETDDCKTPIQISVFKLSVIATPH